MRTVGALLFIVLAAVVVWFLWQPSAVLAPMDDVRPAAESPEAAALSATLTVAPVAAPAAATEAPAQRSEIVAPVAAPPGPRLARFYGRCVDAASKQPLSGCELDLSAWGGNSARMEKYGTKVEWKDPPRFVTGADGKFEFAFDPPPPYQFALEVGGPGRASLHGRWGEVAAGEERDFGDVEMPLGARVTGTITDTKGQVRSRTQIYIERAGRESRGLPATLAQRPYTNAVSGLDGAFAFMHALCAGEWSLRIGVGARLKEPTTLTIEPGQANVTLPVIVFADDELDLIEGVVLDEQDRPAAGVSLDHSSRGSGQHWICSTDRAGKFRLVREEGDRKDPVAFSVNHADGYEPMQDARKFAWGTKDVVLRVKRALAVEVHVLDADTDAPILEYGVRCFPDPTSGGRWSSSDIQLRAKGEHEHGIAQVTGVRRGKNLLLVEPADRDRFAPMSPITFEMTDQGAPRQVLRLSRFVERVVEVVRTGGGAVVGTKVELLLPVGARPIAFDTLAVEPQQLYQGGNAPQALLSCAATTDSEGRCRLRGARGATFVVRVLGPGHAAVLQPDVRLEGDVLRIAVPAGATLVGKLTPARVLAQFAPPAAAQAGAKPGGASKSGQALSPGLQLADPADARHRFPAGHLDRLALAEDGSFRVEGIPAGDWNVLLSYWTFEADGQARSSAFDHLARVDGLAEGEIREITLDIARLELGEVRAVVFSDDAPLAGARGQLMGVCPDGKGGTQQYAGPALTTDAEGRFTSKVQAGTWKVWLMLPTPGERFGRRLPLPESVEVRSGAVVDAVFRFVKTSLEVRVVDAKGQPCVDRPIDIQAEQTWAHERTDAQGAFTHDPALPGVMTFFTWPPDLATQEQRMQAMRAGSTAVGERRITLGTHTIPADKRHDQVTLRLPE